MKFWNRLFNGGLPRASFSVGAVIDGVLVLIDHDGQACPSITNDAEAVVRWCLANENMAFNKTLPIVYRDSMGVYDALDHRDGEFTGFRPLRCATATSAALLVRKQASEAGR